MKIIQDSREQAPYTFNAPRYAGTIVEVETIRTGDYSLATVMSGASTAFMPTV